MQLIIKQPMQPMARPELDSNGEIQWQMVPMARWQQSMFPVPYLGDFAVQWMYLIMTQKGLDHE